MRLFYGAKFINKKVLIVAEFSLKRGKIPKALNRKSPVVESTSGTFILSVFVVADAYLFLKSMKLTYVGSE